MTEDYLPIRAKLVAAFLRVRFWFKFKPVGYLWVVMKNDIFSNEVTLLLKEISLDNSTFDLASFCDTIWFIWKLNSSVLSIVYSLKHQTHKNTVLRLKQLSSCLFVSSRHCRLCAGVTENKQTTPPPLSNVSIRLFPLSFLVPLCYQHGIPPSHPVLSAC
jgi:hypothetical protein